MKLPNFSRQPLLLRAIYHINTPMFVAGANQKEVELTPTTFKGVLRFWWRALNWSNIRLNSSDKIQALKTLHEKEAKLFGVASSDNKGGQGACFVNSLILNSERKWQYTQTKSGVNYLLGQGLFRGRLTRQALVNGQSFSVDLTVNNGSVEGIIDTLKIIGLLGSFGSRSRHGFGSVTLTNLGQKQTGDDKYQQIDFEKDIKKSLPELLNKYNCRENTELPPISAFYQGARIDFINFQSNDAVNVLSEIGENQQLYRSYGSKNKDGIYQVNGKKPERNFADDHDLILKYINERRYSGEHPRRMVFGLPHNYRYSSGESKKIDAKMGRRASPLFQHIHFVDNRYSLVNCLLESEFLPNGDKIKIGNQEVDVNVDYEVIKTFMNRFNNRESI